MLGKASPLLFRAKNGAHIIMTTPNANNFNENDSLSEPLQEIISKISIPLTVLSIDLTKNAHMEIQTRANAPNVCLPLNMARFAKCQNVILLANS